MQHNLVEAYARASEKERKLCRVLGDYKHSWGQELERPHYVMDKMWQMMQSNDTKRTNLDKDFEELLNNVKQKGWNGSPKNNKVLGRRKRRRSVIKVALSSYSQRESTMNFIAEWFFHGEMKVLQGVSVLMSVREGVAVQGHSE